MYRRVAEFFKLTVYFNKLDGMIMTSILASRMAPQILDWPSLQGCFQLPDMADPAGRRANLVLGDHSRRDYCNIYKKLK